jgi:copper chaperone CopZ
VGTVGFDSSLPAGILFKLNFPGGGAIWSLLNNRNIKFMKKIYLSLAMASVLAFSASAADVTVTISDVHVCCQSCVKAVAKVIATVPSLSGAGDQDADTITLTGPDTATVQKGADALVAAGFFGKSSDPAIKINAETGAKDQMVQSLKIENVHLCCGKCVKAVNEVLATVPGVTGNTAAKGATSFEVTGNFNDKAVFDGLQKAGLTGQEK